MKLVATNGKENCVVRLTHYWFGRCIPFDWAQGAVPRHIDESLLFGGSTKYLTVANVFLPDTEVTGWAACGPKDQPSRATGRFIALLRLARGYRLALR